MTTPRPTETVGKQADPKVHQHTQFHSSSIIVQWVPNCLQIKSATPISYCSASKLYRQMLAFALIPGEANRASEKDEWIVENRSIQSRYILHFYLLAALRSSTSSTAPRSTAAVLKVWSIRNWDFLMVQKTLPVQSLRYSERSDDVWVRQVALQRDNYAGHSEESESF